MISPEEEWKVYSNARGERELRVCDEKFRRFFWDRVEKLDECWLWRGHINADGYGRFSSRMNGSFGAHRLSWLINVGPIPKGLEVCHKCDVRNCVRPSHLWLGTRAQNQADMARKGRARPNPNPQRGIDHPRAKLNPALVKEIRELASRDGVAFRALGRKYGVTHSTIANVVHRKNWIPQR